MLPLFDRPVIEHTIGLLARNDIKDITIASSSNAAELAEHLGDGSRLGVKLRYSIEREPLGTAGAVKMAARMVEGTFLVVSGDTITDCDIRAAIRAHRHAHAAATILTASSDDATEYGVVERDVNGRVTRIVEKPNSSEVFSDEVSSGIYILEPEVASSIPPFRSSDFSTDVFPRLLANGDVVQGFRIAGYWRDVNSLIQSRNVHFDALAGKLNIEIPAHEVGDGVWMGDRVEVDTSVEIVGPVYLGTGVRIRQGASIGPRAIIGAETEIEQGARVSNSILGAGCLVAKDASIRNCVIGARCAASECEQMDSLTVFEYTPYERREAGTPETPRIEIQSRVRDNSAAAW